MFGFKFRLNKAYLITASLCATVCMLFKNFIYTACWQPEIVVKFFVQISNLTIRINCFASCMNVVAIGNFTFAQKGIL